MSIEDRSLDALKEGSTATVIDGSDYAWTTGKHKLYSMNESGTGPNHYLHVDSDGSLKANGGESSDNVFKVYRIEEFVMLEHDSTKKVVAVNENPDKVYLKKLPDGTLGDLNNLNKAKEKQPDILFYKVQGAGSVYCYLKSYLAGERRIVGFESDGSPKAPKTVQPDTDESRLRIYKTS